jgi:hypothetical protein
MAGESSSGRARDADVAKSVFIEDVDAYLRGKAVEDVLLDQQERMRRLRLYEGQTLQGQARLGEKLPEIQKSLEAVDALIGKRGGGAAEAVDFEIADSIYARATIQVGDGRPLGRLGRGAAGLPGPSGSRARFGERGFGAAWPLRARRGARRAWSRTLGCSGWLPAARHGAGELRGRLPPETRRGRGARPPPPCAKPEPPQPRALPPPSLGTGRRERRPVAGRGGDG